MVLVALLLGSRLLDNHISAKMCFSVHYFHFSTGQFIIMIASSSTSAVAAAAAVAGPFRSIFGYFLVGILWGCTNPFIKRAQQSSTNSRELRSNNTDRNIISGKSNFYIVNKAYGLFASVFSSLTDRNIFIPYAINQAGSLVKNL